LKEGESGALANVSPVDAALSGGETPDRRERFAGFGSATESKGSAIILASINPTERISSHFRSPRKHWKVTKIG
jgi:hypothetical protein